jgi:hypothetical protein
MGFFKKLFKGIDPFEKPCTCGREAQVRVAPEREFDFHTGEVFCLSCLEPKVKSALAGRTQGCVVVQPYADAPCLVPYLLEELPDLTNWPTRLKEMMDSSAGKCTQCGADAPHLLWLPTEPAQSLSAMQDNGRWFDRQEAISLCPECLTKSLIRTLADRNLRLQEMVFPLAGPGTWLPWAY